MTVHFDLSEVKALAASLDHAGPKATSSANVHVKAAASRLAADARSDVAVRSGATRASIRVEDGDESSVVIADSDAAFYLEFGTSDTAPQPFLWPHAPAAAARLAKAMEDITPFNTPGGST